MEKCTLALRLPALGNSSPYPYSLVGDGTLSQISLNVCQLDYTRTLPERATWRNKPRCLKDVMILLRGSGGTEFESEPFACTSGSHLAYEVSCAKEEGGGGEEEEDPSCLVDVWSNQNATWGTSALSLDPSRPGLIESNRIQGCLCINTRLCD